MPGTVPVAGPSASHRTTGEQRFAFLDLLKPERATVSLLLPYLDWDAAGGDVWVSRFAP